MDTLTHALSGALLARATAPGAAPPDKLRRRILAGFLACAAPDLDFVVSFFGPVAYVLNHRGVTHSIVMLPFWALAVSWLLAKILREPAGWRALYGVTALGIGAHIAGDVITTYGTMILAPLSDWRAAIGTTFIIDPWFSGIILGGLVGSALLKKTRIPAIAAALVLVSYVVFQYVERNQALEFGEAYASAHGLSRARVSVQPRPASPFNWTVFVSDEHTHRFAHVNLVRKEPKPYRPGDGFIARVDAPYLPLDQAIWVTRSRYGDPESAYVKEAWDSDSLGFLRWFEELPAFDGMSEMGKCVWFVDLRFDTPGRDGVPFPFGACRDRSGSPWRAYKREGSGKILVR